jgi:exonuclease III
MKIATYNTNGINGRLAVLQRWLKEASPDVVCLQALKGPDDRFPGQAISEVQCAVTWSKGLEWRGNLLRAGVDRHVRGWEKTSDHAPVWLKWQINN